MKTILLTILSFFSMFWAGYVLSTLWGWFPVHMFPNCPVITTLGASGLIIIARLMTYTIGVADIHAIFAEDEEDKSKREFTTAFVAWFLPLGALFSGWIITLFQ